MRKLFNLKLLVIISEILLLVFAATVLFVSVRGNYGNPQPSELITNHWRTDGPFELSPERGRFALIYSLLKDSSFSFSVDLARFVVPDLGYKDGKYVSLFAPATSFLVAPGFVIGEYLGMSQVGSYLSIALFALINLYLVKKISEAIGASSPAGWVAGFVFLFATPAFSYGVNLYQHHISTFLVLLSSLIVIKERSKRLLFVVWFLCAMSVPVDYPNLFLMLPIGLVGLSKLIDVKKTKKLVLVGIDLKTLITFTGLIIPIIFFCWFNYNSYGNPLQFSGTVASVRAIDENGKPTSPNKLNVENIDEFLNAGNQNKSATLFFESRNLLNGFYLHILSPDRGILYFTPVVLFGIVGIVILHKKNYKYTSMFAGVVAINLVLYSLWGDPWGGWAFGSRYLVPSYALLAALASVGLTHFNRKWLFLILFYLASVYSVLVNTVGAITTSANPPKVEALSLESVTGKRERYSYDRNWEYLTSGRTKSFVHQTWAYKYVDTMRFYYMISGSLIFVITILMVVIFRKNEKKNK